MPCPALIAVALACLQAPPPAATPRSEPPAAAPAAPAAPTPAPVLLPRAAPGDAVAAGIPVPPAAIDGAATTAEGVLTLNGPGAVLHTGRAAGAGDFRIRAAMALVDKRAGNAGVVLGTSLVSLDAPLGRIGHKGALFFGSLDSIEGTEKTIRPGAAFDFEMVRTGTLLRVLVNGEQVLSSEVPAAPLGRILLRGGTGALQVSALTMDGDVFLAPRPVPLWMAAGTEWDEHFDPALLAGTGALHAFCTAVTSAEDGSDRTAILHRASRDGGVTWSPSARVTPAGEPLAGRPVPFSLADGTARVLYQAIGPLAKRDTRSTLRVATLGTDGAWTTAPCTVRGLPDDLAGVRLSVASAAAGAVGARVAAVTVDDTGAPHLRWLESADGLTWTAGPATEKPAADLVSSGGQSLFRSAASENGMATIAVTAPGWSDARTAKGLIGTSQRPALLALPGDRWLALVAQPRPPYTLEMFGRRGQEDWARLWPLHDAATGAACAAMADGHPVALLEAGETGRRETISFVRLEAGNPAN